MDIYYITTNYITLSDGYVNFDGQKRYRRKDEYLVKSKKAFTNYMEASEYARHILEEENSKYGVDRISKHDMELWDAFFIGFHHGCKVRIDSIQALEEYYNMIGVAYNQQLLEIKIETLELDL